MRSVICPLSPERVNEYSVRITGFLVAVLLSTYLVSDNVYIIWFLMADFFIRTFTPLKYSPLSGLASAFTRILRLPVIKIPKAPKIFAARLGFVFTAVITLLYYSGLTVSSHVLALVLILFAMLEAALNICVGCQVYTYIILPFYKKELEAED
ncbi:MAG: DUF4395 domain-containing protein [Ignavibacteria bacterium]|jgi:hypothetical protein|nr:DUF4395 domain-containing protein [Ignavibacteria bacterium]MCU7519472.1 DUF4395 domain-containing protein [Ignavibacteria bacterium]